MSLKNLKFSISFLVFALVILILPARASDIYIAQNSVGADTGADCASAHSASWFNSNATGGNTYHLCGVFQGASGQTMLTVPTSGTANAPLIMLAEPGAKLISPRWPAGTYVGDGTSGGAIAINDKNYVIIDGGTNGIIANENTSGNPQNGAGLPNTATSFGIYAKGSDIIIRNWTIRNIYDTGTNDGSSARRDTADIHLDASSNITICNNELDDAAAGILSYATDSGSTMVTDCQSDKFGMGTNIFLNNFDDHGWHMAMTPKGAASPNVYANNFYDNSKWADSLSADAWHTDGIISYPTASSVPLNIYIFNNYFHGALNVAKSGYGHPTAFIFCTYGSGYSNSGTHCHIFNNVVVNTMTTAGYNAGAAMWMQGTSGYSVGPHVIYNNTFVDQTYGLCAQDSSGPADDNTFRNNIWQSSLNGFFIDNCANTENWNQININNNVFYGAMSRGWYWSNTSASTLAAWQKSCTSGGGGGGCDSASVYGDPKLNGNYTLSSSSNARGLGANLTLLCTGQMAPLCYDKPPVVGKGGSLGGNHSRPTSGNWDAGAYQYFSSTSNGSTPLSPSDLTGTVN